jgi:hypothetical protein
MMTTGREFACHDSRLAFQQLASIDKFVIGPNIIVNKKI